MTIKRRLLLSNIGMIVIPIAAFFIIEIVLGYVMFLAAKGDLNDERMQWFVGMRFVMMLGVLILTNGILTFYVSRSIIAPLHTLAAAAARISEGDLERSAIVNTGSRDELGELARSFEHMRLSLVEASLRQAQYEQNRQELIASISHDLKTPLTSIRGYVKGIQDGIASSKEKLTHYLRIIEQTANRMDRLIDELFLYSKLDLQRQPFQFEPVKLSAFFNDCIDELSYHYQLDGQAGRIELRYNEAMHDIALADRDQLRRAVVNLVDNSIKYNDKAYKHIAIYITEQAQSLQVEISDNGQGIAEDQLPYIFDSFYRTDSSRNSEAGGSGLGLSIVKKIVEAHGGSIWAGSRLHAGTSIYFTLKKEELL